MSFWLVKTEPDVFSFADLMKAPGKKTSWEGVRNYQARNFLRDSLKLGDRVLIYHSNIELPAVYGIAEVVREGFEDKSALDKKSEYYDEKAAKKGVSPWVLVDVKGITPMARPVTRDMLSADAKTKGMMVLKRGARLSVQPVTAEEYAAVCRLGGLK